MKVQLTCGCGRRQEVPVARAGTITRCAGCGKPLTVPALGIAVPNGKRPAAKPRPQPSPFAVLRAPAAPPRRRRLFSCGATLVLLMFCGTLLLALAGLGAWHFGWHVHLLELLPTAAAPTAEPLPFAEAPAKAEPAAKAPDEPESKAPLPATPADEPPAKQASPTKPVEPPNEPPVTKPVVPGDPPAPSPKPVVEKAPEAKNPPAPVNIARPRFQQGDTFLQELQVTQKSRFLVAGVPVATLLQYRVVSRYTIDNVKADGALTAQQKVESAVMVQADDLTQALLAGAVAQLPGTAWTLEVNPRGEVTKLAAAAGPVMVGPAKLPGGLGVQMASLLDADGWKELGQATFYRPENPEQAGRFSRPMTHTWGPLGGWAGQVTYAFPADKAAQVKVPYTLKLGYHAPKGPGAPGALPFKITGSRFQAPQAAGTLLYDRQLGKTVAAEERFYVRGALTLLLLGQNTATEVEEEQTFQMRIVAK